jgi:predicted Fe-Mo cluster-binding NifX family protein
LRSHSVYDLKRKIIMKIAVTSTGESPDSQVDQRFGRAAYFIIFDTETMIFRAIDNENVAAAGGAGINSAKVVIDTGAEVAERTLSAGKIKLYTGVSGTVSEAVEFFKSGKLTEAEGPNVQSHFGTGMKEQL